MAVALENAARSSVFDLAYDHSNTNFNPVSETIMQGQDLPIHLGSRPGDEVRRRLPRLLCALAKGLTVCAVTRIDRRLGSFGKGDGW